MLGGPDETASETRRPKRQRAEQRSTHRPARLPLGRWLGTPGGVQLTLPGTGFRAALSQRQRGGHRLERQAARNGPRPRKRTGKPRENGEVRVKLDALKATDAQWRERPVVHQATELPLDHCAASVELAPAGSLARRAHRGLAKLRPIAAAIARPLRSPAQTRNEHRSPNRRCQVRVLGAPLALEPRDPACPAGSEGSGSCSGLSRGTVYPTRLQPTTHRGKSLGTNDQSAPAAHQP